MVLPQNEVEEEEEREEEDKELINNEENKESQSEKNKIGTISQILEEANLVLEKPI